MPKLRAALAIRRILLCVGSVFLFSPILLYWFIHGSYERYIWIIHQPFPLSSFGGGPFQLWMDVGGVLVGVMLVTAALVIKTHHRPVKN